MDPGSKRATSKRADYYGTFLEAVREPQSAVQQDIPSQQELPPQRDVPLGGDSATPQTDAAAEEEVVDPIELLKDLRDSGPQEMSQLQQTTNLRFSRFAEVVAKLEEAGLLKISGQPGAERVELMPAGATLAELG